MDKMREEFESWAKSEFDIDCSEMSFGVKENDKREQYHNDDDPDGAITVSAMFYAWKASRAALCVELPHDETYEVEDDFDVGYFEAVSFYNQQLENLGVTLK